jgi:NAD(P)-dependent dehydrogenase (short-subunit alcohol dehydrogenase family)
VRLESGQVAVVTGAASGIGRALAEAFARRGLTVVAVDVERDALDTAVAAMREEGLAVEGHVVDVRRPEGLDDLARHVMATHGRVDVLCNNAGVVTPRLPVWEQPFEDLRWTTEVNLYGVANGVRAFVPHMVAAGRGHVVNTSSVAGLSTIPGGGNGVYSASKHAVVGLSETMRVELASVAPDVGVTVLCPGPVPSRIHDAARNRPAGLAVPAPDSAPGLPPPDFGLTLERVEPAVVADQVLDAVERNLPYVLTAPDVSAMARDRATALIEALDP